ANVSPGQIVFPTGTVQNISAATDVILTPTNIEGGSAVQANTNYYLYAAGSNFRWSTLPPTKYKMHPISNWVYLAWSRTNASNQLQRMTKCGQVVMFKERVSIFTLTGPQTKQLVNVGNIVPPFTGLQVFT